MLRNIRYALRVLARTPGVHADDRGDARARHRREQPRCSR